jgi:transposase
MAKRITPMKIREIFRMYYQCNLSQRKISLALKISRKAISNYINKYELLDITYDELNELDDNDLFDLFSDKKKQAKKERYQDLQNRLPGIACELKKKGVTLQLLWEEYIQEYPDGYKHSQFFNYFRKWKKETEIYMPIEHDPGDKMFADFTGYKMSITDIDSGTEKEVETFVSILGCSGLAYAEAVESQQKEDWIKVNDNSLWYYEGSPQAIVPDNLKSAVTKACKYEPDINPDYADFARHYNLAILPARPYSAKDKALVENMVRNVYRRIFAPLRNKTFYSLKELNTAIKEKLEEFNNRPMQKLKLSRRQLFNQLEKQKLKPLPKDRYKLKSYQMNTSIQLNYHVELKEDRHYYSVPYKYRGKKVNIIYTDKIVEIFFNSKLRIALHCREKGISKYTTLKDHMPSHHKFVAEWTPMRIKNWALKIGKEVEMVVDHILKKPIYPEQAFKTCIGIISLAKKYTNYRLNNACKRAINFGSYSLRSIKNILSKGLDNIEEQELPFDVLPDHNNIRGSKYYQ